MKEKEDYKQQGLFVGEHELEPEDPTENTETRDKYGKKHRKGSGGKNNSATKDKS